jgi:uncharacterized phage infection (PIP) family protein YhgE
MANRRIIDGKNTPARLAEEFQRLLDMDEHITVTEFAGRVGISAGTLNHKYRDWAEKVRKIRDAKETQVRKRSPVTFSQEKITEVDQAIETIVRQRQQIQNLSSQVEKLQKENKRLKTQMVNCRQEKEYNERLRGLVVSLQQEILRHMSLEQSNRLLRMIEEHATCKSERDQKEHYWHFS